MGEIVQSVFGVFTEVGDWFIGALSSFVELFYNTTSNTLTFVGVMALVGVGIAVTRMLFAIITSFVQMKGGN